MCSGGGGQLQNINPKGSMKTHSKILILALALSGSAFTLAAQDDGAPPPGDLPPPHEGGPGSPGRPGGPGGSGRLARRPPPSPLMRALDANGDGIIDEQEIENAPAALRKLDKNGDGKLTPDELRPPLPPPLPPPGEGGPDGPGGAGIPGGQEFRRAPGAPQAGDDGQALPRAPRAPRPPRPPQSQTPPGDR